VRLARSPYPLPLGGIKARRSLLSLDNLVEAIDATLVTPEPLRRPLIVADPEPVSVPEMVAAMRRGLGRSPRLIPVPAPALRAILSLAGKSESYARLTGSLAVDPSALRGIGWRPATQTAAGLAALMRA
jgi:nucleoside-diphosphate-sugar epimerase